MWYLTSENDGRVIYIVPQSKEITIGRNTDGQICNVAISDDASISRKHVTLSLTDNGLALRDLGSRYGTFVNNFSDKIDPNVAIKLQDKDVVRFGKLNSLWKVNETHLVTCTSTLKGENLQNLKACLTKLGGILKNEWDDSCMYLTMPAITLTIKVVLALVQGSYIVTTDFWSKCLEAVNSNGILPDPKQFTPQIIESTLNKEIVSFSPNTRRKTLFEGKKIVFFSKRQCDMYKSVLNKSSGSPLLLSESTMTKSMLCEQDVIVIQYNVSNPDTQDIRSQINDITSHMKFMGKRVVADAEIGLAILYCSTEKYCNPNFNFSSEVMKQTTNLNQKPVNILAQESQDVRHGMQSKKENIVINESLLSENSQTNISKRKLSADMNEENVTKKFAKDNEASNSKNNRSIKRKNSDDTNHAELNPSKKIAAADSENNEDDDIFNFINPVANSSKNPVLEKKLNLTKPMKRKHDISFGNDDDLFQFVQNKSKTSTEDTKPSIFSIKNSHNNVNEEVEEDTIPPVKNNNVTNNIDISALRGSKLEELMKSNLNVTSNGNINICKIKKENSDDLDEKMNNLDLGSTIVTIKKELIIKKENLVIEPRNIPGKNFKKFKKVWPLKMQITLIPHSSTSSMPEKFNDNETCSQSYDDIQE